MTKPSVFTLPCLIDNHRRKVSNEALLSYCQSQGAEIKHESQASLPYLIKMGVFMSFKVTFRWKWVMISKDTWENVWQFVGEASWMNPTYMVVKVQLKLGPKTKHRQYSSKMILWQVGHLITTPPIKCTHVKKNDIVTVRSPNNNSTHQMHTCKKQRNTEETGNIKEKELFDHHCSLSNASVTCRTMHSASPTRLWPYSSIKMVIVLVLKWWSNN